MFRIGLIGTATAALLGLIGVVLSVAAVGGVLQLILAGLVGLKLAWTAAWLLVAKAGTGVMLVFNNALKAARIAVLLFNLALWANPITLVVLAVMDLVAGLVLLAQRWR